MMVPAMPMARVATAPPGSRPGMTALANRPTSVPKPTQTRTKFAMFWSCSRKAWFSMVSLRDVRRLRKERFPVSSAREEVRLEGILRLQAASGFARLAVRWAEPALQTIQKRRAELALRTIQEWRAEPALRDAEQCCFGGRGEGANGGEGGSDGAGFVAAVNHAVAAFGVAAFSAVGGPVGG